MGFTTAQCTDMYHINDTYKKQVQIWIFTHLTCSNLIIDHFKNTFNIPVYQYLVMCVTQKRSYKPDKFPNLENLIVVIDTHVSNVIGWQRREEDL